MGDSTNMPDMHIATMASTTNLFDHTHNITLTVPLPRRLTSVEDSEAEGYGDMYGVEVALLTRRFTLEPKDNNNLIGGHTIIFHTPHVAQNIKGVEFRRFGQQGNIGRYPLHFRKCEDSGLRHRSRFAVSYLLAYSRIISLSNRLIRYERVRLWQCSLQESREGFEPTLLRHPRNSQRNTLRECRIRYIWPLLFD